MCITSEEIPHQKWYTDGKAACIISTDAQHQSLEYCKSKKWDTTTYLSEQLKSKTL